jgi:hypothetical protein
VMSQGHTFRKIEDANHPVLGGVTDVPLLVPIVGLQPQIR